MFDKKIHTSISLLIGEEAKVLKPKFERELNGLVVAHQRDLTITEVHFFKPKQETLENYPDHRNVDLLADVTFLVDNVNVHKAGLKKFNNSESWHRVPGTT